MCKYIITLPCAIVKVFGGYNTALCKEPCKNKSVLIDDLGYYNLSEKESKFLVLSTCHFQVEIAMNCKDIQLKNIKA